MTTASTSMAAAPYQELATAPGRMAGTPRRTDLPVREWHCRMSWERAAAPSTPSLNWGGSAPCRRHITVALGNA
jgi:hypothetical protein